MKQKSSPFPDLAKVSVDALLKRLRKYGFRDPIGHPLENTHEFHEVVRRLKEQEASHA